MSVLLPGNNVWNASNWVVRSFFEDALPFVGEAPLLAPDVQFFNDAGVGALDLRGGNEEALRELTSLVGRVIEENLRLKGSNFHDPTAFPVYMGKLEELREMVDASLERTDRSTS
jgi:hypothetical protein